MHVRTRHRRPQHGGGLGRRSRRAALHGGEPVPPRNLSVGADAASTTATIPSGHDHGDHGGGDDRGEITIGDPEALLAESLGDDSRQTSVRASYRATSSSTGHAHDQASVRTAVHNGHTIEIRTSYDVRIDGEPLEAHMGVSDDGNGALSRVAQLLRGLGDRPDAARHRRLPGGLSAPRRARERGSVMAATRRDITTNQVDAERFVQATLALKSEASGLRASDIGIGPGPLAADRDLSTWDLFIVWHVWAMQQISVDGRRNAAHMGPVFLPWHRWYLLVLEAQMQPCARRHTRRLRTSVLGLGR